MLEGVGRFGMEDRRPASLLVASISERANRNIQLPTLQLPGFRLSLPGSSPRISPEVGQASSSTPRRSKAPSPPNISQAGEEVQRMAAMAGGVMIAAISKAVHHLKTGHDRQRSSLPFHQSFSFPWGNRGNITQR